MKKVLQFFLLGFALAGAAGAAIKVNSGDEALKQSGEEGIMVFTYAEDWDHYSKKLSLDLMADAGIEKASGDAVILTYPSYALPSKEREAELEKLRGKLKIPNPLSYPAILFLSKEGVHLSSISGQELRKYSKEEIAQKITERHQLLAQHRQLSKKAAEAQGAEKVKLLGQIAHLPHIKLPKKFANQAKALDPHDESGYVHALETNEFKLAAQVAEMDMQEAMAYVDKILVNERYSIRQKQAACAGLLGMWRKKGTRAQLVKMRQYSKKMEELAPDNLHGISARYIRREWLKPFNIKNGWFKSMLTGDPKGIALEGKVPMNKKGTYSVTMKHTSGRDALKIKSVTLYDGDKIVAQDAHDGHAGATSKNNVYTLHADKDVAKPRLVFVFAPNQKKNTQGRIIIKKQ